MGLSACFETADQVEKAVEKGADVSCSITHKGKVVKEAEGEGLSTAGGCVRRLASGRIELPFRSGRIGPDLRSGPIVSAMVHGGNHIRSTDLEGIHDRVRNHRHRWR